MERILDTINIVQQSLTQQLKLTNRLASSQTVPWYKHGAHSFIQVVARQNSFHNFGNLSIWDHHTHNFDGIGKVMGNMDAL